MPTNESTPNVTAGQRARNYWWNPANRPLRNIAQIGRNILMSGGNPLIAAANTARHVALGEAREAIGNAWNNRGSNSNSTAPRSPSVPGGAPLPSWMSPGQGAPTPTNPASTLNTLPNYGPDQTYAGPPVASPPGYGVLAPTPQGPSNSAGLGRAETYATGNAAGDYVNNLFNSAFGPNAGRIKFDSVTRSFSQA